MMQLQDTQEPDTQTETRSTLRRHDEVEWTPLLGTIRGTMAAGVASLVLAIGWWTLARRLPDSSVTYLHDEFWASVGPFFMTALTGLVSAWILFAVVHRVAGMVGGPCPVIVAFFVLLLALVKQLVLVEQGVHMPSGLVQGWVWLQPVTFLKSNLGVWAGLILAIAMFRKGDSFVDLFST